MERGEPFDEGAGKVDLTVHENPLIGNKHIIEDHKGLTADHAEIAVAGVDVAFHLAFLVGLTTEDHGDAGGIQGDGRHDGEGFVAFHHVLGGHDHDFMAVDGAGLVGLGTANDHAVGPFFDHVHEHIGIGLLARALGTIALGIGHPADQHEILFLQPLDVFRSTV